LLSQRRSIANILIIRDGPSYDLKHVVPIQWLIRPRLRFILAYLSDKCCVYYVTWTSVYIIMNDVAVVLW